MFNTLLNTLPNKHFSFHHLRYNFSWKNNFINPRVGISGVCQEDRNIDFQTIFF